MNRYPIGKMILIVSLFVAVYQFKSVTAQADSSSQEVPQAVHDLVGTYVGSWTAFGIDGGGNVVEYSSWTDVVTAENPQIEGEKAYVHVTDDMVFEDSDVPPMQVTWTEGYFLLPDGSLGDNFIESFGQTTRMIKLSENVWASAVPAHAEELASFGFSNVSTGQHVTTKVVTSELGVETHRVTRVTTVNWTDQDGQDRWLQFVSLKGVHQRQSE